MSRRAGVLPAAVVLAAMVALEIGYGAEIGAVLLYLGYTIAYRILPGVVLYRTLATDPGGPVKQLALGWLTGMALEIGAFMLTAALDVRWLFSLYPLFVVLPLAVPLLRGRRRDRERTAPNPSDRPDPRAAWAIAGLCVLAIGLIAMVFFPTTPEPGSGSILYFQDIPWHLSLAADAKNHWPIEDPNVSGEPLPYHYFFHIQMAAASQVTGIDLPQIFFRLAYLPLVALLALLLVTAGRVVTRSVWCGVLAGLLVLFVGDLQLQTDPTAAPGAPFLGVFITFLHASPSFLLGITFLFGLVITGHRLLATAGRVTAGDWAVFALLAFGASEAKVIALPILLAALGLLTLWSLWRMRRFPPRIVGVAGIAVLALTITYLTQYRGHSSGLSLDPFESFEQMPFVAVVKPYLLSTLPDFPLQPTLVGAFVVVVGTLGLTAPLLAGYAWLRGTSDRVGNGPGLIWSLTFFVAGLLVLMLVASPGTGNQLYFAHYGIAVGWVAAAAGYALAWSRRPGDLRAGPALAAAVPWVFVMALVVAAPGALDLFSGDSAGAKTFLLWYGGLALSLLALGLYSWRVLRPRGWWTGALLSAALLSVGLLGTVCNYVIPALSSDAPAATASAAPAALTPDIYEAMEWIRDETRTDAVLAVNNTSPYQFDWAGFAERRVFLSGAAYTRLSLDRGYDETLSRGVEQLFPQRFLLNTAAFAGDRDALATLSADYGVSYLVVEPRGNVPVDADALREVTEPVYEAGGVEVLRLLPQALPPG